MKVILFILLAADVSCYVLKAIASTLSTVLSSVPYFGKVLSFLLKPLLLLTNLLYPLVGLTIIVIIFMLFRTIKKRIRSRLQRMKSAGSVPTPPPVVIQPQVSPQIQTVLPSEEVHTIDSFK